MAKPTYTLRTEHANLITEWEKAKAAIDGWTDYKHRLQNDILTAIGVTPEQLIGTLTGKAQGSMSFAVEVTVAPDAKRKLEANARLELSVDQGVATAALAKDPELLGVILKREIVPGSAKAVLSYIKTGAEAAVLLKEGLSIKLRGPYFSD